MLTDYHVHLERGPLSLDWLGLFVDQAARSGIGDFGISEHGHRFAEFRPTMGFIGEGPEADKYFTEWLSHHFKSSLDEYSHLFAQAREVKGWNVKAGLEIDYIPGMDGIIKDQLSKLELDYVLGSVHFLGRWGFDHAPDIGWPGMDVDEVYKSYFDAMNRMILSGLFDIVSHPDVIKIFGHRPSYDLTQSYEELAANMGRMGMVAELSTAGLRKPVKEIYPSKEFLRVLKAYEIPIAFSSDAHTPEDVGYGYPTAVEFAKSCGYKDNAVFENRRYTLVAIP